MKIKKVINRYFNKNQYASNTERLNPLKLKEFSPELIRVMNLLIYTKKSNVSYSGGEFNTGYHTFDIDGHQFKGQRNPKMRLEDIPFSFDNLSVLDIGCNQGGMLYELSNRIKFGVGVDYDSRMINVANKMKSHCKLNNLDYFVFDLEKENLDYLSDFLPEDKVDVVFLLSICMWIENWREVVAKIPTISRKLIFESNGKPEQQQEQIDELKKHYKTVQLIREKSTDDPSQKNRQLFYCTNEEG